MNEILGFFKDAVTRKYAQFSGRARRKEFWGFVLIVFLLNIVLSILDQILGTVYMVDAGEMGMLPVGIISSICSLALIIPNLAIGARRLHDIDRSGWWLLLMFIPFWAGLSFWSLCFCKAMWVQIGLVLIPSKSVNQLLGEYTF